MLAAALLAAAPALASRPPKAEELLGWVLDQPDIGYEGRTMITEWFGKQARAEEVEVYHASGNRVRREFLAPDGRVRRVIVTDGDREQVYLPRAHKIFAGDAARVYEKVMPSDQERQLLLANYDLIAGGPKSIAGRACWTLEFKPKFPGKPSQKLWIDQRTRTILENKRFLPGGAFAAMSRFVDFEPRRRLDDSLFELSDSSATVLHPKNLEPQFLSLDELAKATGRKANLPDSLPGGFQFESADYMKVGRNVVRQARYTDGLAIVSIFVTDKPVRLPKQGTTVVYNTSGPTELRLSASGKVLNWRRGRESYTAVSDVSRRLLLAISASLK